MSKNNNFILHGDVLFNNSHNVLFNNIIDKYNIDKYKTPDIKILNDILENDIGLRPNGMCGKKLKEKITNTHEPFSNMINTIIKSILKRHPGYLKFIKVVCNKNIIFEKEAVTRGMHYMLLLENMVQMMIDSPDFKNNIVNELIEKRRKLGLAKKGPRLTYKLLKKVGLFNTIKLLSVDASFRYMSSSVDQGHVPKRMLPSRLDAITLNILEAVYFEKNKENNILGKKLAKTPPTEFKTETVDNSSSVIVKSKINQNWDSDYLSWNLAFITGNLGDFDILLPKLLIPSVIASDPEQFMFRRVYSLWLSINFCLFRKLQKTSKKATKTQIEISKIFAKINNNRFT